MLASVDALLLSSRGVDAIMGTVRSLDFSTARFRASEGPVAASEFGATSGMLPGNVLHIANILQSGTSKAAAPIPNTDGALTLERHFIEGWLKNQDLAQPTRRVGRQYTGSQVRSQSCG
jgi:hypothetical protein